MALGAAPGQILRRTLIRGMQLSFAGVILGMTAGFFLSRFISSLLFSISPTDPLTYAAVSSFLLTVALSGAYIPARRASRVDPLVALRHE